MIAVLPALFLSFLRSSPLRRAQAGQAHTLKGMSKANNDRTTRSACESNSEHTNKTIKQETVSPLLLPPTKALSNSTFSRLGHRPLLVSLLSILVPISHFT